MRQFVCVCVRVCACGRVAVGCVEALGVSQYREMRDVPIVRDTLESQPLSAPQY